MDLAWHTHQLCPSEYRKDTSEALGGEVLPHDDSVNDRAPGSKLCNSEKETVNLWKGRVSFDFIL